MSDSCPPKLDGEMLWNLAKAIKHKKFNFNILMALFVHDIDKCLLMDGLGYLGSLKSK